MHKEKITTKGNVIYPGTQSFRKILNPKNKSWFLRRKLGLSERMVIALEKKLASGKPVDVWYS